MQGAWTQSPGQGLASLWKRALPLALLPRKDSSGKHRKQEPVFQAVLQTGI